MSANIMSAVEADMAPFRFEPFGLYRQRGDCERAHFLGTAETLDAAKIKASDSLQHKDTLLVYERDERNGKQALHIFKVRQQVAQWRRNEQTGLSERWHPLTLDRVMTLPWDGDGPARPFDAFRDDAVGVDRSLVEGIGHKQAVQMAEGVS